MQASDPMRLSALQVTMKLTRELTSVELTFSLTPEDLKLPLGVAGSGLQRMIYEMLVRGLRILKEKESA